LIKPASVMARVSADPLGSSIPLPHRHVLFPYGLPVQIKSNDLSAIRIAEDSWGSCHSRHQERPIEIRVVVSNCARRRKPPPPIFRAQGNLMTIVADAQNYACCDLARGLGFAMLTPAAARNREYLRYYFIEAMAYTMLDALHLVIFHAACTSFRGRGFVFVGDSGAGKSSLAYACAKSGWSYLSDDATAILRRRPRNIALGNPRTFRFRPAATELFPELNGPIRLRNLKPTMEIPVDALTGIRTSEVCPVHFILFLRRTKDRFASPTLLPIDRESALQRLFYQQLPEELEIAEERFRAIEALLDGSQVFEFVYSDLESAIRMLQSLAGES